MTNTAAPSYLEPDQIAHLQHDFESAHPQDILQWATQQFGDSLAVVTSFQPTGIVTLHMLSEMAPHTAIITLDTEFLFPETYALIDRVESLFNLNLIRVRPELTIDQQAAAYGDKLWVRNPDQCCHMRKTLPLKDALVGYSAWVTGVRRDQSSRRSSTAIINWDSRYNLVKLCPFANWTEDMVWTYIQAHDLPYNELHDRGYPSIGCLHCTQAVTDGADPRSGRWAMHQKTECGIHISSFEDDRARE
ncbi:MAG: phosphoadenylyl-sulfate reductase [Anaerolineae bacterium]|nr:phosphoadenylyl-sulfate reductase [Anaerolineae bacterium]